MRQSVCLNLGLSKKVDDFLLAVNVIERAICIKSVSTFKYIIDLDSTKKVCFQATCYNLLHVMKSE